MLPVKDLDFERCEITVRRGKGKDRRVMLSGNVRPAKSLWAQVSQLASTQ